jgi:hypothetical protein
MESTKKPRSKFLSVKVLDFIAGCKDGIPFGQIQRFIWTHRKGYDGTPFTRNNRGCWCTNLLGSGMGGMGTAGLLSVFCYKQDGLWFRNEMPHEEHPWRVHNRESKFPQGTDEEDAL